MRRFNIFQILFIISLFIAGTVIMLYPALSSQFTQRRQRRAADDYTQELANRSAEENLFQWEEAKKYNEDLWTVAKQTSLLPDKLPGYEDILNIDGSGVMGRITIEKIGVDLPIYHNSSPLSLEKGAGHLEGSSLPVGGESTHCVITAHRGLPGAKLFTDLDRLNPGDKFTLHVLDEDLNYEIDKIITVLPTDMEVLRIVEGEDYCTLLTCTPYGINTHRLVVRGHRVP